MKLFKVANVNSKEIEICNKPRKFWNFVSPESGNSGKAICKTSIFCEANYKTAALKVNTNKIRQEADIVFDI